MSFAEIMEKAEEGKPIVFRVSYTYETTGRTYIYNCPICYSVIDHPYPAQPENTISAIYADSGHLGCLMYVAGGADPEYSFCLVVEKYNDSNNITYGAKIVLYTIPQ